MRGRFPGDTKYPRRGCNAGPKSSDRNVTVETVVLWPCIPDPLVRIDFETPQKLMRLFLSAKEARALGERLIAESDKIAIVTRHIEYRKTKQPKE